MALISEQDDFCADDHNGLVVGVAAEVSNHASGIHFHEKDQLLFSKHGCMTITLEDVKYVLPPMRAAWIPKGVQHDAQMTNITQYRSLYFDQSLSERLPRGVMIFDITALMRVLIERMAFWAFDKPNSQQINTLNLFIEELNDSQEVYLSLPLPQDHRLKSWLSDIDNQDFMAPSLAQLSEVVGASEKTITRIFNRETGMPYQSWRQQWRLLGAIELLSSGMRISDVADRLEFSSDSAFIHFFRQKTGMTPMNYMTNTSNAETM
ncbi:AraC family transcriptional regulator [Vibrio chagasii]|uniref:AraC family transcriptional regulator n=1 Tax=Vibrio chagasii TaxID=170679 RepID=UPI001EFCEFBD|nr:helix-turn-helix transcriptional regulator [Vibrio chagasii]MCG9562354.1 helix-turn-helix transcriptional regulator [Vibrio chagasii]CAH7021010.1 AraC family transcriptional regulator [Vibrio chagasii]CAH7074424.1 AraC family transcriptional regulator [Vibrio chagasii]CAH7111358.1 AraC family transcriptional regulator [Vibrio chagasii]CAH7358122.1 AraC family transcriptional regulator [Vibrio chagasii]